MPDDGMSRADELQPGQRLRRGARLCEVTRVAVTPGQPVVVTATTLINGKPGDPVELRFGADEQVRVVAPTAKAEAEPGVAPQAGLGI